MIDPARVCLALDGMDLETALRVSTEVQRGGVRTVKVGLGLWCRYGAAAVRALRQEGLDVFLDLKLHDIPHQVALATEAVRELGASLLTIHSAGGAEMIAAAKREAGNTRILAVTVLTSLEAGPGEVVARGTMAVTAGADGLVCSPLEARALRSALGETPLLVTPGIRAAGGAAHDQRRTATASEALDAGSSLLVVGRPILEARTATEGLWAVLGHPRGSTAALGEN